MSPAIVIRPERADHPQVMTLLDTLDTYLRSLYPPDANHILSVQELLAPEVVFVAAWQGDAAVGCGAVRRMPGQGDTGGQPYGEIKRMFVQTALRGQRIAERVIQTLEAQLIADGITLALLETGRDQHAAVRLYERCGYARCAVFGGYLDNGLSLFMQKRLVS